MGVLLSEYFFSRVELGKKTLTDVVRRRQSRRM